MSPRQREVWRMAALGAPNKGIAHRLGISAETVKNHLTLMYAELGVSCRAELTLAAFYHGIVTPGDISATLPPQALVLT